MAKKLLSRVHAFIQDCTLSLSCSFIHRAGAEVEDFPAHAHDITQVRERYHCVLIGRMQGIPGALRLCELYEGGEVEDFPHFLLRFPRYAAIRAQFGSLFDAVVNTAFFKWTGLGCGGSCNCLHVASLGWWHCS